MLDRDITLADFASLLPSIDWCFEGRARDLSARASDRTSPDYLADHYIMLPSESLPEARKLLSKYPSNHWSGWRRTVSAARRRRAAFVHAVELGVLSGNPADENYHGHYFYDTRERSNDLFRHRKTLERLTSPVSKGEIEKYKMK